MLSKHLGLAAVIAAAAVAAACGPATPPTNTPPTDVTATPTAPSGVPTAPPTDTAPTPTATPTAPPTANTPPPPASLGNFTSVGPSNLAAEVKKIGIDLSAPLDFDKLPLAQKKKLMPLFVKALGYEGCAGCHVEGDFKKQTRNVQMAKGMWNHFVKQLRDDKGAPLFCDSCHQGKAKPLDRTSRDGMKPFMKNEYVGKLTRADRKDNTCGTCHGDTIELHIFEKSWGVK
jgi:hypothetical protein